MTEGTSMPSLTTLANLLGVPPDRLDGLRDLAEGDLARLAGHVEALLAAEDAAVEEGVHRTLAAVPAPLRGRARAVLLGEDA